MGKKRVASVGPARRATKAVGPETEEDYEVKSVTTAIHIPENTWKLLRAVAFHRAQDRGGRASVSRLLTELVERHREELEREVQG